ncbi:MAG: hypothetical protein EYC69_02610 [Bacteroidetes bacterium]|nr:MAG: hypothetical protein EYC69_02610 [Bacteroidota bacterium]
MRLLLLTILVLASATLAAQERLFPLNRDMNTRIGSFLARDTSGFHSSIKPYSVLELKEIMPYDSIFSGRKGKGKFYSTWVGRKLFKEHFIQVDKDDIILSIDPVFNLQLGQDRENGRNVFVNTKGVLVQANVKDKFYFYTGFHENQARYVNYVDSLIRQEKVVPGQGKVKVLENETFDFSQSFGGIGYKLDKHFDFLFAHDKNFIGEGYRSLLLSDNTYNYPFLRIQMSFWKFRYAVYYAVMQDLRTAHEENVGYFKKYSTMHHLDVNIGKTNWLNIGLFETVMWAPAASRGYELHYLNPIIFLRPVENSADSPDNALLGLNMKLRVTKKIIFYGQLMLDELLLDEVRAGNGWWGNKQAFQLGVKTFDLFRIKNLNLQTEFNFVRPYTYQHRTNSQNYTHYNQPLAHPLGANFAESVSFINYRWRNIFLELKVQYAKLGRDTANSNLGNDIFKSYETRSQEYNNRMFQGLESTLNSVDLRLNYLVNPKTNFNIELGVASRQFQNANSDDRSLFIYAGLRMALENYYFDF